MKIQMSIGIVAMVAFLIASIAVKGAPAKAIETTADATTEIITEDVTEETTYEHWTEPHREYIVELKAPEVSCIKEFRLYDLPLSEDIQRRIYNISLKYKIDELFIYAMIRTESNYRFVAGDNGNSIGYMQIQPRWWSKMAQEHGLNIYDEGDNIEMGILILTTLMSKYDGNLVKALKAYNCGNPNGTNDVYVERTFKHLEEINRIVYGD